MIWTGILDCYLYYWCLCLLPAVEDMDWWLQICGIMFPGEFIFPILFSLCHQPGGSLITAVFRLANVNWSTPLTRIAEIIAVSAIVFASLIIIVDMGRPERFYNLFIHGRLQSPIMWDVIVISTYFFISLLFYIFLCCRILKS